MGENVRYTLYITYIRVNHNTLKCKNDYIVSKKKNKIAFLDNDFHTLP